jgi:hypothetical protein
MEIHIIKRSDMARCPKHSMSPQHYRDDGTCRCNEQAEAEVAVTEAEAEVRSAQRHLAAVRDWKSRT